MLAGWILCHEGWHSVLLALFCIVIVTANITCSLCFQIVSQDSKENAISLKDCKFLIIVRSFVCLLVFKMSSWQSLKGRNLKKEYTTESWDFYLTPWSPSILKIPEMKQCWIDLWTFSQVTTLDLFAWCCLCLCYSCVTLKADVWGIACCLLCESY